MIKARATSATGRQILILGLSHNNLDMLRENKPIHVFGEEMDLNLDVIIFAGATENQMAKELKSLLAPGVKIDAKPRVRN